MTFPPDRRLRALACTCALLATLPAPLLAEEAAEDEPLELDRITVEAEKRPTAVRDIAGVTTVIDADRIEQELVQNIDDLVRYEPGIDVVDQGSRFGRAGFNIRGLGGNRVLIEVDGAPVSDAFAIGDFSNASRDFVDVDSLKAVEIIRGPSSALFGSDALGGVVSFVTKDPEDYLLGDENGHLRATGAWYGLDSSWAGSATAVGRSGDWGGLVTLTYRAGNERNDIGADPLDYDSLNFLGKLTWGELGDGGVKLTVEDFRAESLTDLQSQNRVQDFTAAFGFPYVLTSSGSRADDSRERTRFGLEQSWADGVAFADWLRWRVFWQDSETRQETRQDRTSFIGGVTSRRELERLFDWHQENWGGEVNAASDFELFGTIHELAYGFEFEATDTNQFRDGAQTDPATGETSNRIGPDVYPVRDFPVSETELLGIYLQDRFSIGPVTVIPALRWDDYQLTPRPDAIFIDDNPGITPAGLDESEWSPKLGVLWDVTERWQVFAQYNEGFRAPPVNDVNVGFTNFQFGYTAIPNPDLRSETSQGIEGGVRYEGARSEFEVSAFRTDYDDFIVPFQVVGFDPVNQVIVFQSVNLDDVRIEGLELRGQWAPSFFPEGLWLRYAASFVEGDDRVTGEPLLDVAPPNGVLGLEYAAPSGRWGASFLARGAEEQDRLPATEEPLFVPDSYLLFDLSGFWKPTENTRLRGGVFNLFDEDYTAWLDVAGLPADTPNLERLRRPGLNVSVAFDWQFN